MSDEAEVRYLGASTDEDHERLAAKIAADPVLAPFVARALAGKRTPEDGIWAAGPLCEVCDQPAVAIAIRRWCADHVPGEPSKCDEGCDHEGYGHDEVPSSEIRDQLATPAHKTESATDDGTTVDELRALLAEALDSVDYCWGYDGSEGDELPDRIRAALAPRSIPGGEG